MLMGIVYNFLGLMLLDGIVVWCVVGFAGLRFGVKWLLMCTTCGLISGFWRLDVSDAWFVLLV